MKKIKRELVVGVRIGEDNEQNFLIQNTFSNRNGDVKKRTLEINPKAPYSDAFRLDFASGPYEIDKYKLTIIMSDFLDGSIEDAEAIKGYIENVIQLAKDMREQLDIMGWAEYN